jgi:hypothetical protein
MVSDLVFSQLVLVALVWLCLLLPWAWPSDSTAACRRHQSAHPPYQSATVRPHPLRALPPSRPATPVSTAAILDQPQCGPYLHDSALLTLAEADLGPALRAAWAVRLERLKLYKRGERPTNKRRQRTESKRGGG